jgi:dihydrofolate reductase
MRQLVVIEFITLDGVMQGLGSPDEDRDGGFEYGGWAAPYGDAALGQKAGDGMTTTTAYLLGRKTYEKMATYWPHEPCDNPIAAHLNSTPKYVVTNTLRRLDWAGSEILAGDLVEATNDLKAQGDGTIAVLGSGALVQTLIANHLIDEYRLFLHPVVLGAGKRLFRETARPLPMRLADCTPTSTGVLLLSYQPANRPRVTKR